MKNLYSFVWNYKFLSSALITTFLLAGCSSSTQSVTVETPTPTPTPTCSNDEYLDRLTMKKINRNPSELKGTCGFMDVRVRQILRPQDCAVAADYGGRVQDDFARTNMDMVGIFIFANCAELRREVFDGDLYKVLVINDGPRTQNGSGEVTASFTVLEAFGYGY